MSEEGFSGYPEWVRPVGQDLSVQVDVETYTRVDHDRHIMVSSPVRTRIVIEGTIEQMAVYRAILDKIWKPQP